MILKSLWQKYKTTIYTSILFFISLFLKFDEKLDIPSISITCLSIIFGFAFSFILGIYTQKKMNVFMKKEGILDGFIKDNRAYLLEMLYAIIFIFVMSIYTQS